MKKIFILISFLIFVGSSWAELQVLDPQNVLKSFQWIGRHEFERSFDCHTPVNFRVSVKKVRYVCDQICKGVSEHPETVAEKNILIQAEDCLEDSVNIYGSNLLEINLDKNLYENGWKTWMLGLLKQSGLFIQPVFSNIIIDQLFPIRVFKIKEGVRTPIHAWNLLAHLDYPGVAEAPRIEIIFDPEDRGINQLLIIRENQGEYFLKQRGVLDESGRP